VLTLAGLLVSVVSLLNTTSIAYAAILGPLAFIFILWICVRKRRIIWTIVVFAALLVSVVFVTRVYSAPDTEQFFYSGVQMDTTGIPYANGSIPLTGDPSVGYDAGTIDPVPSDAGPFTVSCTYDGVISTGARSTDMEWAYVTQGKFKSLWVPVPFLRGLAPGAANSLLPCRNWRWRLQNFDL
jgi:hypothetical protein